MTTRERTHLLIYCDGSVRTGGRGGIGVVIADADGMPLRRLGEPLPFAVRSSNEAEYHALLRALKEALRLGASSVEVYLDSELVRQQVLGNWACNHEHLQRLKAEVLSLLSRFEHWELHRVPSERNPMAHTLANVASCQNRRRFWRRAVDIDNTNTSTKEVNEMILEFRDYQPLPTGSYHVRVLDVQQTRGNFGDQLTFTLEVVAGEHKGRTLKAWCNPSASTGSKLYRWGCALLRVPRLERLDLRDLAGKEALAQVVQQQTYSRVQDLLPLRKPVPATSQGFADPDDPFEEVEED